MSASWWRKAGGWVRRYLPAEAVGTICAILGGLAIGAANPLLVALGGTWGENLGYYGTMIVRDLRLRRARDGRISPRTVARLCRDLTLEFGGAELLDSVLIRPAAMFAGIGLTGNVALGLLVGKLAADIAFYLPTILAYELRVRFLGE